MTTATTPARSPLTRDRIAAHAVAELDAHGVERLTMRRLAQAVEVTATALYWHVATKDDVLDLAFDRIFAEVEVPEPSTVPYDDARALLLGWRATMVAHPWSPALVGRAAIGPNVLTRTEFLQDALARAGLHGRDLAVAVHLLANYLVGATTTHTAWASAADDELFGDGLERLMTMLVGAPAGR